MVNETVCLRFACNQNTMIDIFQHSLPFLIIIPFLCLLDCMHSFFFFPRKYSSSNISVSNGNTTAVTTGFRTQLEMKAASSSPATFCWSCASAGQLLSASAKLCAQYGMWKRWNYGCWEKSLDIRNSVIDILVRREIRKEFINIYIAWPVKV